MDSFVSRKKRKVSHAAEESPPVLLASCSTDTRCKDKNVGIESENDIDMDTDTKLAILASLHPELDQSLLFEALITANGSVSIASSNLSGLPSPHHDPATFRASPSKRRTIGLQTSLPFSPSTTIKPLTRKGQTLHLYTPQSIADHTPCSLVPNFVPQDLADDLLRELINESKTFEKATFKLFDNIVQSPHSACFYVSPQDLQKQKSEYLYNGYALEDVRELTPVMIKVQDIVQKTVNAEIEKRIKEHYPGGVKLKGMSPKEWEPNAAFVNLYDGGKESVGWHSDQLTYLGPRAVIGSISLGVAREFRVRKIVPKDDDEGMEEAAESAAKNGKDANRKQGDAQGQIAIHLPHNSLLVMHAEMQEEWKHSVAPANTIDPHPIAGSKRINITYRHYREELHPNLTPRCKCGVATVLRCVQKRKENRGRYMWQCHAGNAPG